jgi:hypothetical protein
VAAIAANRAQPIKADTVVGYLAEAAAVHQLPVSWPALFAAADVGAPSCAQVRGGSNRPFKLPIYPLNRLPGGGGGGAPAARVVARALRRRRRGRALVRAGERRFKYSLIWEKNKTTQFL